MGILQDDVVEDVGSVPACQTCGSERVARPAYACWNPESGLWELETVLGGAICHQCGADVELRWSRKDPVCRKRVAELNDAFRCEGQGNGSIVLTSGVQALEMSQLRAALEAVRHFDSFTPDNDPWGEHDFGAVEIDGEKLFWKIDAYDLSMTMGSPNPANEAVTKRILTLMLASEY